MSLKFYIVGQTSDDTMHLSYATQWALLEWLRVSPEYGRQIPACELATLVRQRLSSDSDYAQQGFMSDRAEQLLRLAEAAGGGTVAWD